MGPGDVGPGDVGLGDVGLGDVGLGDTRGRDKQTTPNICAEFVEYNFRWSRESYFTCSRWFSASMVWPDIFSCLFDREISGYRIVSMQGVLKHPCLILVKN